MSNDNHDDVSPLTVQHGKPWGAQNSLRRNAGLKTRAASDEVTPLLGDREGSPSGDGSEGGEGGETAIEWEGANDFIGVPWWKTPSVRCPPIARGIIIC